MSMGVEIKRVVQDLGRVAIEQVLHEAIMNSIQAHAKNINVDIEYQQLEKSLPCLISSMTITDDGDGFTEDNIKSFQKYKTTYKQVEGAKGVGRFLFLKLFDRISIFSLNNKIEFNINDVVVKTATSNSKQTIVSFLDKHRNIDIDLDTIENNIREHFLPYFHLMKKDDKHHSEIKINLVANNQEIFSINSKEIPTFKNDKFDLKEHEFYIDYVLDHYEPQKNNGFYCADNRVVIKNNKDRKSKLESFKSVNILFLLSSKYLDAKVNDTRDDFFIHHKQKNSMFDLSWADIQDELSKKLKDILLDNDIDVEEKAKEELNKAIEKAPYLSQYLSNNPYGKDSDVLIKSAENSLIEDKKIFRDGKHKSQQEYKQKLDSVNRANLAEYIFDRQNIIDDLKKINKEDTLEKEIHNLFMKQNTTDDDKDYKSNNLWLFDDRFMIYDKAFSDKQIKEIFPELGKNLDKPDILSIVSNTYKKEDITDIVIIELKKPSSEITPAGAEEQLLKYARYVNQSDDAKKIRIWTYAFLAFNKNTINSLNDKSYNKIPTQSKHAIYYKYHDANNVIINFMDYEALAADADTRNKTFMNILTATS